MRILVGVGRDNTSESADRTCHHPHGYKGSGPWAASKGYQVHDVLGRTLYAARENYRGWDQRQGRIIGVRTRHERPARMDDLPTPTVTPDLTGLPHISEFFHHYLIDAGTAFVICALSVFITLTQVRYARV